MVAKTTKRTGTASFMVRVYYTENGTWQGQVAHVQTGAVYNFQSMLEMIRFMDDHLASQKESVVVEAREG